MEFYWAMRKNKIMSFAGKWIELESIMLSEVTQFQKDKGHLFSLMFNIQHVKIIYCMGFNNYIIFHNLKKMVLLKA
jgi:hypothetical protein